MIGKEISHYRVVEKLGGGGMGVVYKALDLKLDRYVALKFLPPAFSFDEETKMRFIYEAKTASSLEHKNICTVHEIGETDDGQLFIAMSFYEGETLKKKIENKSLSFTEIIDITIQIAEGLQKAHEKGIIHRDIKPANIFVTSDGTVKILDFGLAKGLGGNSLTRKGTTVGTAAYMSPEQAQGENVDNRSDIWSLGVVLYEMITSKLPFKGEYEQAIIYSILNEEPTLDTEEIKNVRGIRNIIESCLAKDKKERYQNAEELISDLKEIKANLTGKQPVHKLNGKFKKFKLIPALSIILFIGFAILYFSLSSDVKSNQRIPIAVVDFQNETGESELNGLSGMLITALEQSERLCVTTRSRMFDILRHLGKENLTHIDEHLGREICERANINTLAIASIRKFGNVYTIDMKVLDVGKNEYLFTVNVKGDGKESIPDMIDKLSEETRTKLNEKISDIQAASKKVAEITTSNLDAYQHFFKGEELIDKLQFKKAQKEFEQAIKLDPDFGLAYYRMAYATDWEMDKLKAEKYLKKAFGLFEKIPDKEKYIIKALMKENKSDFDGAIAILKKGEKRFPNDKEILYNIGDWSYHAGYYEQAEKYLLRVLEIDPTFPRALQHLTWTYKAQKKYDKMLSFAKRYLMISPTSEATNQLAQAYFKLGKYDKAINEIEHHIQLFPNDYSVITTLAEFCVYTGKVDKAEKIIKPLLGLRKPDKIFGLVRRKYRGVLFCSGRYKDVLEMSDTLVNYYWARQDTNKTMYWILSKAIAYWNGWHNLDAAWAEMEKTLKYKYRTKDAVYVGGLSLFYLRRGELDKAMKIISMKPWKLTLLSLYEIKEKNYLRAKILLDSLETYNIELFNLIVLFQLAKLQLELGMYNEVLSTLQRMEKMSDDFFLFYPIYYPKLYFMFGKAYEALNNKVLAKENYKKFLSLWKDADKDLPELIEAKRRLKKL